MLWSGWTGKLRPVWAAKHVAGEHEELDGFGRRHPILNYFGRLTEMFLTLLLMARIGGMTNREWY